MTSLEQRKLKEDINSALSIINGGSNYYTDSHHYRPYIQTNEPLSSYYPYFELSNKKILTVTGSGDQILEAVRFGAKEIVAFDQNRFAYYVAALKLASIPYFTSREYFSFFSYFDFYYYGKVRPYLEEVPKAFWDAIFKNVPEDKMSYFFENYFSNTRIVKDKSLYFEEENLNCVKERLPKTSIRFISTSLHSLPKTLRLQKTSFDAIFLSNIYDWLGDIRRSNFADFIATELSPYLNDGGKCCAYIPITLDQLKNKTTFEKVYLKEDDTCFYVYQKTKRKE